MGTNLRVLNVEDSEDDAMLLYRYLSRAGYNVLMERVDTPEAMELALTLGGWDVVIADYVLPRFSAPEALAMVKAKRPGLPFLLITGAVGEETVAVAALRAGAHDYLLKNSLGGFVQAIALAAGVVAPEDRAAVHLMLGREYLLQEPEPNLAKATYHGEEAMALAGENDPVYAQAMLHLGKCYIGMGQPDEAVEILRRFEGIRGRLAAEEAVLEGDVRHHLAIALEHVGQDGDAMQAFERADHQRWLGHLERGRYQLLWGDPAEAVREAITALHLASNDSLRCFECYMLLLACAQKQGHGRDALNFGISARMMAMEAERHDLGYVASEALGELIRHLGDQAAEVLHQVEQEYRKWNLDIWQYLPGALDRTGTGISRTVPN